MTRILSLAILVLGLSASAITADDGFKPIFDGKTLKGWDGNTKFWSVKDGAITGQTTKDNPTRGNTFCVWRAGKPADFELKLKFKIQGGNSGIQYRSREVNKWVISGYQADFDGGGAWTGTLYEEKGRGILARRGNKVQITAEGKKVPAGKTTPEKEILASVKKNGWNDYHIVAIGNKLKHIVNGKVTIEVEDHQANKRAMSGLLALQLHAGPPMTVQFKDILLKEVKKADAAGPTGKGKKVVFMAGRRSHGYGSHEHHAGCLLLSRSLKQALPDLEVVVHQNGWPRDEGAFDGADTVVMYCDGGGRHPANRNLEQIDKLAKKGVGVVCIHYGVEVPKGEPGNKFLEWIGGYFETHWSVNPHWDADFTTLPEHAVTRGVKPFKINDEWYYHMRFRDGMKGVKPILTAIPPKSTLSRPDGAHSGNPHVRKKAGKPQHVAWATEREDGGRGFGFTGGHFHWNWGDPNFRKIMLNAIAWTSKIDIPSGGISDKPVTLEDLKANQDETAPGNYNYERIRRQLNLKTSGKSSRPRTLVKPAAASPVLTGRTPGKTAALDVNIKGAKQLFLVVGDGGNGYGCDWADWIEPTLIGPNGVKKKLTDLKWKSAQAGFGTVSVNKNAGGKPLRVGGKSVAFGIGTHAKSVIAYDLPPGYERFQTKVGLDNGGTDQNTCGKDSSVQFFVYTKKPSLLAAAPNRDPESAVAGLDVAKGLEVTLVSSEPAIRSLTNLDIDHRGRIWVCEVINYRHNNGKRPEGDRILILEDKDGDGKADETKVYYQGRDIDSAMGIAVLGNKVIVSATPNVFVFTDTNGDDKPDKKEVFFSKVGQPQHDHSAHSFLFGPDGKLYWNFGNTGKAVHDPQGKVVVDRAGNRVVDNGKPYYGGMPFRCNMDGSQFEVLAHNFRNNYEVSVDSFGTLWQSDNDDDGNRAVRINFVMEFGNYGYRDELTGAGWRSPRTNMNQDIPLRHWHLRDPGVVPNLLQTGAGSPTGITVYEGRLLPKVFWDQVIHCDAGPNVVRAYPATTDGAGYKARIENLLVGTRDNWFRPADVCVAPDGSVFVTDWYDPGVGGHRQGDIERGRLFRIAPPGHKYKAPKYDFSTIDGAIAALKSPNLDARYMAWQTLNGKGIAALDALEKMFSNAENPRHRARALWLLTKMDVIGEQFILKAARDKNPDIRIVALRAARQIRTDVFGVISLLVQDPSPAVRRECAVALRHLKHPSAPDLWAELAMRHDGRDRWYLEALGIAAELNWDNCLSAWIERVKDDWKSPAGRDIVWRSRAKVTAGMLVALIADPQTPSSEVPRLFRALDYQNSNDKSALILNLAFSATSKDPKRSALVSAEAVQRIGKVDLSNQKHADALNRIIEQAKGTERFVTLVDRFNVENRYPDLLAMGQKNPSDTVGVSAVTALLAKKQYGLFSAALRDKKLDIVLATIQVLANTRDGRIVGLLLPLVRNGAVDLEVRRQATRAVAMTTNGAKQIISMAEQNQFPKELHVAAAFPLNNSPSGLVREKAAKLFPLPPVKNSNLPPISKLVTMRGDIARGQKVFATTGTCAKCHVVKKEGKEVGPNLSEIGSKLSRQALLESILYPSAGISHNYETYALRTENGNVVSGILVSQTDESVVIKSDDAIVRTYKRDEIEAMKKQPISLMPADLQKTMTAQDLTDVVEYLTTLKKKK